MRSRIGGRGCEWNRLSVPFHPGIPSWVPFPSRLHAVLMRANPESPSPSTVEGGKYSDVIL